MAQSPRRATGADRPLEEGGARPRRPRRSPISRRPPRSGERPPAPHQANTNHQGPLGVGIATTRRTRGGGGVESFRDRAPRLPQPGRAGRRGALFAGRRGALFAGRRGALFASRWRLWGPLLLPRDRWLY